MGTEKVDKIKILHIITGLNVGGAEMSLCKLVENIDSASFDCSVVSFLPKGPLAERIKKAGIPVHFLEMDKRSGLVSAFWRLWCLVREVSPDMVQTWMYHADLLGGIAGKLCGVPVVWNIRHSNMDPRVNRRRTVWIAHLCALLSGVVPAKIVCCAYRAMQVHAGIGYNEDKMLVIPNGFDLDAFHPDGQAERELRLEIGVPDGATLVGAVGRYDTQKGFVDFFRAAREIVRQDASSHFLLCGKGMDWGNEELVGMMDESLRARTRLLGARSDIPCILPSLDVFVMSSIAGEAFPNVVGEAMACGVPCVVTDVGDAARIVGDTGCVVPPGDWAALAASVRHTLDLPNAERASLGRAARLRICENYDIKKTTKQYEELYRSIVKSR